MKKAISFLMCMAIVFSCFSMLSVSSSAATSTQTMANVVYFVRFSDDTTDAFNKMDDYNNFTFTQRVIALYNDTTATHMGVDCSFKKYISEVSRGKLNIENVFPQYSDSTINLFTLKKTVNDYGDDGDIISEVITAINNGSLSFNLSGQKIDNRESDVIDNLTVILQGGSDENSDITYPHKSVASESTTINGKYYVRNYNFLNSSTVLNGQKQGVITHEFLHSVGLPDLYRNSGEGNPVGYWDIMASTSPYIQYMLSYQRANLGWVDKSEITQSGHYTLDAVTSTDGNVLFEIKTPMSDTESFMLEYRIKKTDVVAGLGFETKIPSSGLLIYRVNKGLDNASNFAGQDYIYVFRPGDTSTSASAGDILDAAVNPDNSETSYGSADFTAKLTDNTIFYSDGKNSGITLTNVAYSADKSQISFDVTLPDYSSLDMWDKLSDHTATDVVGEVSMASDENSNIYVSCTRSVDWNYVVDVYKWTGEAWSKLGSSISGAYSSKIYYLNNTLYLSYTDANGYMQVDKIVGDTRTAIATDKSVSYAGAQTLFSDGTDVYLSYVKDSNQIFIKKIGASALTDFDSSLTTTGFFANPSFTFYNNKLYTIYSAMSTSDSNAVIKEYDSDLKQWDTVKSLNMKNSNSHSFAAIGNKLYATATLGGTGGVLATLENGEWTSEALDLGATFSMNVTLATDGTDLFLSTLISDTAKVFKKTSDGWVQFADDVVSSVDECSVIINNNTAYVSSYSSNSGLLAIRSKAIPQKAVPKIVAADKTPTVVNTAQKYIYGIPQGLKSLDLFANITNDGYVKYSGTMLGTNTEVQLYDKDDKLIDTYKIIIFGDADGDSYANATDAVMVALYTSGMITRNQIDDSVYYAMDATHDGNINADDYTVLCDSGAFNDSVNQNAEISQNVTSASLIVKEFAPESEINQAEVTSDKQSIFDLIISAVIRFISSIFAIK